MRFDVQTNVEVRARDGVTLTLDTYVPRRSSRQPGVVLVHGGSWTGGDKSEFAALGAALAQSGWVAIAVNYRLGVGMIDRQAEDILTTMDWARDHAGELHLDPRRVALLGASAGGHLAALAATRDSSDGDSAIRAVVTWSGIFDLGALAPKQGVQAADCNSLCQQTFGRGVLEGVVGCSYDDCPGRYADASPVQDVSGATAPMLLANSEADAVPADQAREMATRLRRDGVPAELVLVDGQAHGYELGAQVWMQTRGFLGEHLERTAGPTRDRSNVAVLVLVAALAVIAGVAVWYWTRARARRR